MKLEAVGVVFSVVLFIIIMTTVDIQERKHYNSFTGVLDGDVLSYECQQAGVVIDTQRYAIHIFGRDKDSTYTFDQIRETNYTLPEGGKFYGNGALRGMNNAAIINWGEQFSVNKRSGLNILTNDIKNPMWKVNVPLESLSTSNHELYERWILVSKKYVL